MFVMNCIIISLAFRKVFLCAKPLLILRHSSTVLFIMAFSSVVVGKETKQIYTGMLDPTLPPDRPDSITVR